MHNAGYSFHWKSNMRAKLKSISCGKKVQVIRFHQQTITCNNFSTSMQNCLVQLIWIISALQTSSTTSVIPVTVSPKWQVSISSLVIKYSSLKKNDIFSKARNVHELLLLFIVATSCCDAQRCDTLWYFAGFFFLCVRAE